MSDPSGPAPVRREAALGDTERVQVIDDQDGKTVPQSACRAPQAQRRVAGYALEVRIGAEQLGIHVDACLGDDAIDGSAYGNPLLPELAEQTRCSNVAVHRRLDDRQGREHSPSLLETLFGPKALKDFRDDDRKDRKVLLFPQGIVESLHLGRRFPVEETDHVLESTTIIRASCGPTSTPPGHRPTRACP